MSPDNDSMVRWEFCQDHNNLWKHRYMHARSIGAFSETFTDLAAAIADAEHRGLDRKSQYWTVHSGGRTTHFRPGRAGVNAPSGMEP